MSDPMLDAAASATATAPAPPDEATAQRVLALTQMLLGSVEHAAPKDRLDGLLSAYFNAVLRTRDEAELRNSIAGLARVRLQLLQQLPQRPAATIVDTVEDLARLIVEPSLRSLPHNVALSALITAYRDIVQRHPCCLEASSALLRDLSQQLAALSATQTGAGPGHVH